MMQEQAKASARQKEFETNSILVYFGGQARQFHSSYFAAPTREAKTMGSNSACSLSFTRMVLPFFEPAAAG
ncbi:hypothetical protein X727_31190 [Mesorhizobium sp. L103C119B0]|nr:hypothetical protein X727_31190 [Mesorhizobium sp. L103C119B0]